MRILALAVFVLLSASLPAIAQESEITCGTFVFNNLYEPAKDAQSAPKGFFADVMRDASARLGLKAHFSEVGSFATAYEELNSKRYDMLCASISSYAANYDKMLYSTALFYDPLYPYGDAKKDYSAIKKAQDINDPKWRISGQDGELSAYYAPIAFPKAQRHLVSQLSPVGMIMTDMFTGKADIVLLTRAAANAYEKDNPGTLKQILDKPIALYPVRFVFRKDDLQRKIMFDTVLEDMKAEGAIERFKKSNGL